MYTRKIITFFSNALALYLAVLYFDNIAATNIS